MAYRTTERFTVGDSYCLGASFPNYVPLPPVPSLSKRKLFAIFSPYGPIYFVARAPNLLDVPASGRKETHASPLCFWRHRFGEPLRNSSRVAALADCWRLRSVVGGSGGSSHLDSSEPNSQKAIGGKDRKGKDCKAKNVRDAQNRT